MQLPLLTVQELTVKYDGNRDPTLSKVSFEVEEGESCGISGDSGCGKSTLGYALLNLLPPTGQVVSGSIFLRGMDLMRLSNKQMCAVRGKKIAMVSQDPEQALNPLLRIGVQVEEVLRSHFALTEAERQRRVAALLAAVGLPESSWTSAFPHELSGGQRQRVVIAQALAAEPELLIADEPTSSLDRANQTLIVSLLLDLKKQFGLTMLFITHDQLLMKRVADRVLVLSSGRLSERT